MYLSWFAFIQCERTLTQLAQETCELQKILHHFGAERPLWQGDQVHEVALRLRHLLREEVDECVEQRGSARVETTARLWC